MSLPKPNLRGFLFALAILTTLVGFKSFLSIFLNTVCSLDLFSYKWLSLPLAAALLVRSSTRPFSRYRGIKAA